MTKIFIVGVDYFDGISQKLVSLYDNFNICHKFSTDKSEENNDTNTIYIDTKEILTSYKNNAILYMTTKDDIIRGVIIDDIYNSDVITMTIEEFNMISNKIYNELDLLIVFVDNSSDEKNNNISLSSYNYFFERAITKKFLYFLNENTDDIANVIYSYITGDDDKKAEILEMYS